MACVSALSALSAHHPNLHAQCVKVEVVVEGEKQEEEQRSQDIRNVTPVHFLASCYYRI